MALPDGNDRLTLMIGPIEQCHNLVREISPADWRNAIMYLNIRCDDNGKAFHCGPPLPLRDVNNELHFERLTQAVATELASMLPTKRRLEANIFFEEETLPEILAILRMLSQLIRNYGDGLLELTIRVSDGIPFDSHSWSYAQEHAIWIALQEISKILEDPIDDLVDSFNLLFRL